jgi:hypothetical protein
MTKPITLLDTVRAIEALGVEQDILEGACLRILRGLTPDKTNPQDIGQHTLEGLIAKYDVETVLKVSWYIASRATVGAVDPKFGNEGYQRVLRRMLDWIRTDYEGATTVIQEIMHARR